MALKRWLRGLKWLMSLLALAFLLSTAAWVASNWKDAPAQPRPAVLQLPGPSLPDDRNAYFTFAGLHAAPDREPSIAGLALWKSRLAKAAMSRAQAVAPAAEQSTRENNDPLGKALPSMSGSPLVCDEHMDNCVALWLDKADTLSAQLKKHALLGQRCERLLDGNLAFDEALAPMPTAAAPIAQHGVGVSNCSRWFLSSAVLALAQQDRARVIAVLTKADRMNRALLNGSHSLIGHMIAIRVTRNTLGTVAALAVRDPSLSTALLPLLTPLPDQTHGVKRWMAFEAAFNQGVNAELSQSCDGDSTLIVADGEPAPGAGGLFGWLCRHRIGWHPERNAQAIDTYWVRSIGQLDGGLATAIEAHSSKGVNNSDANVFDLLTWRNTLGTAVLAIGQSMYGSYLARHADLGLHHEAAVLALKVITAGTPAAQRRRWLEQQPLSPPARGRVSWSDDGLVLSARAWQEPFGAGTYDAKRDAIRIAWPSSQ